MKTQNQHYLVSIGNNETLFKKEDIKTTIKKNKNIDLSVPIQTNQFVLKYKNELLSDFYKNYNIKFNSKEEEKAIKLMFDTKNIMEELSIDYWIEGGTLLGAVRD